MQEKFSSRLGSAMKRKENPSLRGAIVTVIITVFVFALLLIFNLFDRALTTYSDTIELALVVRTGISDSSQTVRSDSTKQESETISDSAFAETINNIVTKPWTKSYTITSSEQALNEFVAKYGEVAAELMPINPFPQTITIKIARKWQNSTDFAKIISYLRTVNNIEEIRYREDYVNSFFSIKKTAVFLSLDISAAILLVLLIFLLFISKTDIKTALAYSTKSVVFFMLLLRSLLYVVIGTGLFYLVLILLVYQMNSAIQYSPKLWYYAPAVAFLAINIINAIIILILPGNRFETAIDSADEPKADESIEYANISEEPIVVTPIEPQVGASSEPVSESTTEAAQETPQENSAEIATESVVSTDSGDDKKDDFVTTDVNE